MANVLTPAGGIFRRLVEPGQEVEYGQKPDVILDPSKKSILHFLKFLPTPSARRATSPSRHPVQNRISFLSTPSARRATDFLTPELLRTLFLSTPSARRATAAGSKGGHGHCISIHALREEGDKVSARVGFLHIDFYPRPPRGGRLYRRGGQTRPASFLSTPSVRRATHSACSHAEREQISIHALREEGDTAMAETAATMAYFYPRPPRGGRPSATSSVEKTANFYPRPPRGGRPSTSLTPSVRS